MKIGIIVGSTRPGRLGSGIGEWVLEEAKQHSGADFEIIEIADYDLSLLGEATVPGAANRNYENPNTTRWSQKIDELDGFVFVTPEYNHSVPAAMKNAFDVISPEWSDKTVAFVGYGADSGIRAVEHWRTIVANSHLYAVRPQLSLSLFTDFGATGFAPDERRQGELKGLLDVLIALTGKIRG